MPSPRRRLISVALVTGCLSITRSRETSRNSSGCTLRHLFFRLAKTSRVVPSPETHFSVEYTISLSRKRYQLVFLMRNKGLNTSELIQTPRKGSIAFATHGLTVSQSHSLTEHLHIVMLAGDCLQYSATNSMDA